MRHHPEMDMDLVEFAGWRDCIRLADGAIELIVTTAVGPRIISARRAGGENLLWVDPETAGRTGGDEWRSYGGHRLWLAPETLERTYVPDNGPAEHAWDGTTLRVSMTEPRSRVTKTVEIAGAEPGTVRVRHRLRNDGAAGIEVAPWALTVCADGGRAIVPQEPFLPHPDVLTPARPLVLWHYTDMSDSRFTWGRRYLQLRQVPGSPTKAKVGLYNHQGWAAYLRGGTALIKRYPTDPAGRYADLGCNTEIFTNESMLELETMGPLAALAPGAEAVHDETWSIVRADVGDSDDDLDHDLLPIVQGLPPLG
jgi:hypothetical protein